MKMEILFNVSKTQFPCSLQKYIIYFNKNKEPLALCREAVIIVYAIVVGSIPVRGLG